MRTAIAALIATTGCAADEPRPPVAELSLRAAMGTTSDLRPIGVAIAPDGQRFVFDETAGLFRIEGEHAVAVVPMAQLPDPGPTTLKPPITDLVAVAPNVFALTAIGDGFLLDTAAMTLRQHFCYVPDGLPVDLVQRTDAIAFDPKTQQLLAQPVTFNEQGVLQYAQLAAYDRTTGTDVEWHNAPADLAATAMAVLPDGTLMLGQGSRLSRFDRATDTVVPLDDLARFGVRSVDGLAVDTAAGTLVVVDSQADALFDIDLAQLAP